MLALAFTFPAGRYHGTSWGRHVNEGAVAWPPEPWRILRSLIAIWHQKVKHGSRHTEATLLALTESMAEQLPEYRLPAASHSHTRHYMPQFKAGDTSLVFDAFAAVARDDPLTVVWPDVELPEDQTLLLDELLAVMTYLGRAESWVEARRIEAAPPTNCRPGSDTLDTKTGEVDGEVVVLLAPQPKQAYGNIRKRFLTDKKAAKQLGDTLPDNLLAALSVDTADLRKQGWNQPPAARKVNYLRPLHALRPRRTVHKVSPAPVSTVQFLLAGKLLPRVEDSIRIGEIFRAALMSHARHRLGPEHIPAMLSGHDLPAGNRHGHAFYLPWDADGDGHIDRLVLHVPSGIDGQQRRIAEALNRLWDRDGGGEWRVLLEGAGAAGAASGLCAASTQWESATPYLHPWHCKKNFGVEEQIRRECRERGLPDPVSLERLPAVTVNGQPRRTSHFRRIRNHRGIHQPDRLGSFWRLTFVEPLCGPLALGFACHFGLGLFLPR